MIYLLQRTKQLWITQIIFNILSFYKLESTNITNKIFEIIAKIWITFLTILSISGILKICYELITNPTQFNNTSFGIFDYI